MGSFALFGGPNFMFKALEQASMYGQADVMNTDSLRFTCMAVSTERSDGVGCTKSAIQLIFVQYMIQISEFHMRKLDLNRGLRGPIIELSHMNLRENLESVLCSLRGHFAPC